MQVEGSREGKRLSTGSYSSRGLFTLQPTPWASHRSKGPLPWSRSGEMHVKRQGPPRNIVPKVPPFLNEHFGSQLKVPERHSGKKWCPLLQVDSGLTPETLGPGRLCELAVWTSRGSLVAAQKSERYRVMWHLPLQLAIPATPLHDWSGPRLAISRERKEYRQCMLINVRRERTQCTWSMNGSIGYATRGPRAMSIECLGFLR